MWLAGGILLAGAAYGENPEPLDLQLQLARLEHPFVVIEALQLQVHEGQGELQIGSLALLGQRWNRVRLQCGQLDLTPGRWRCHQGRLQLPGQAAIALELEQQGGDWWLRLQPGADEMWRFRYQANGRTQLSLHNASPRLLTTLLPSWRAKALQGRLNGELEGDAHRFKARLSLSQAGYSSPDGRQAAEALQLQFEIQGRRQAQVWQVQGSARWSAGLLYQEPVLLEADNQRLRFAGRVDGRGWKLDEAVLDWPRLGEIEAQGQGSWQALEAGQLRLPDLDLQTLGEVLLRPWLESRGLPRMALSGRGGAALKWQGSGLQQISLEPRGAGLVVDSGRLALEGLSGRLEWQRDQVREGELRLERLALGRLETGAFRVPLRLQGRELALRQALHIPLLETQVVVDHFKFTYLPGSGDWQGRLGLSVQPLALEALTRALDLPTMTGRLSANLPAIHYARGEASLEGDLVIQVFDGNLSCTELRLIDPFGPMPRILADVTARHLDLGQMTQTFSFGQMTGFIDADLRQLEIAQWRPLAFDARIVSSPGSYPRRISQKAVENITALGGGGAMAAVQGSFLRFFQDFGYRRIGLSCRLENGVCHMGGIAGEDRNGGYAIVEGGGIPALTVIGYNRNVDWNELVSRLQAAIRSSAPPVIK